MVIGVMAMPGADLRREKAVRLFSFVSEYLALTDKANRSSQTEVVLRLTGGALVGLCYAVEAARLQLQAEPPPPPLPPSLRNWVDGEHLGDPQRPCPTLRPAATFRSSIATDDGSLAHEVRFIEDYPSVRSDWERYARAEWSPWAAKALKVRAANADYMQLARAFLQTQRSPHSLALALSSVRVDWVQGGRAMSLHVAVRPLRLGVCDSPKGTAQPPSTLLRVLPVEGEPIALEDELEEVALADPTTASLLVDGLGAIGALGYEGQPEAVAALSDALAGGSIDVRLVWDPCIVLRSRGSAGLLGLANLAGRALAESPLPLPTPVLDCLLGVRDRAGLGLLADPAFPLPVHPEQEAAARAIAEERCVVIHCPSADGRARTIASVVAGLMAEGKRMLITSRTGAVIRDAIATLPPDLRGMWACVGKDVWRLGSMREPDGPAADEALVRLELARIRLSEAERDFSRVARLHTTTHQFPGGFEGTPEDMARALVKEEPDFGWLPFSVGEEEACPLEGGRALELLRLFRGVDQGRELEIELVGTIPRLDEIPPPQSFEGMVRRERQDSASVAELSHLATSQAVDALSSEGDDVLDVMSRLLVRVRALHLELSDDPSPWVREAADDLLMGRRARWAELWSATRRHLREVEAYPTSVRDLQVAGLGARPLSEVEDHAKGLLNHLRGGGSLGFLLFRSQIVRESAYIAAEVTLDGEPCNSVERLLNLRRWLEMSARLRKLSEYWSLHMMMDASTPCEQVAEYASRLPRLRACMELDDMRRKLQEACARYDTSPGGETVSGWMDAIEYLRRSRRLHGSTLELEAVASRTSSFGGLRQAVRDRDPSAYAEGYARLREAWAGRALLTRRKSLLSQLGAGHPERGRSLLSQFREAPDSDDWDQRYACFAQAWRWQRANSAVKGLAGTGRMGELACALRALRQEVRAGASALAAARCGPGQGLMAPLGAIGGLLDDPAQGMFDIALVDEADAIGPEGLITHFLARSHALLGDASQARLSPFPSDQISRLRREYLAGTPLAGGSRRRASYMDMMVALWGAKLSLPAGPGEFHRPSTHVSLHRVARDGSAHDAAMAEKAAECLGAANCGGQTLAVVASRGLAQARLIEERLLGLVGLQAMVSADVMCTDVAGFAGHRRDNVVMDLPVGGSSLVEACVNAVLPGAGDTLFVLHCEDLALLQRQVPPQVCSHPEGSVAWSIQGELRGLGYMVEAVKQDGARTVDLLVQGASGRLGVAVHGGIAPAWDDSASRALGLLEDEGLPVLHLAASEYLQWPTGVLQTLQDRLHETGIEPQETPCSEGEGAVTTEDGTGDGLSLGTGSPSLQVPVADAMALFVDTGHEVIDKRSQGGCLWVLGGRNLAAAMDELRMAGLYFEYAPGGGRATAFRSAWYTR